MSNEFFILNNTSKSDYLKNLAYVNQKQKPAYFDLLISLQLFKNGSF
jgi:hypothetical protein